MLFYGPPMMMEEHLNVYWSDSWNYKAGLPLTIDIKPHYVQEEEEEIAGLDDEDVLGLLGLNDEDVLCLLDMDDEALLDRLVLVLDGEVHFPGLDDEAEVDVAGPDEEVAEPRRGDGEGVEDKGDSRPPSPPHKQFPPPNFGMNWTRQDPAAHVPAFYPAIHAYPYSLPFAFPPAAPYAAPPPLACPFAPPFVCPYAHPFSDPFACPFAAPPSVDPPIFFMLIPHPDVPVQVSGAGVVAETFGPSSLPSLGSSKRRRREESEEEEEEEEEQAAKRRR